MQLRPVVSVQSGFIFLYVVSNFWETQTSDRSVWNHMAHRVKNYFMVGPSALVALSVR